MQFGGGIRILVRCGPVWAPPRETEWLSRRPVRSSRLHTPGSGQRTSRYSGGRWRSCFSWPRTSSTGGRGTPSTSCDHFSGRASISRSRRPDRCIPRKVWARSSALWCLGRSRIAAADATCFFSSWWAIRCRSWLAWRFVEGSEAAWARFKKAREEQCVLIRGGLDSGREPPPVVLDVKQLGEAVVAA